MTKKLNLKSANVKVVPLKTRSGNATPNQFSIETNNGNVFQSYDKRIAFIDNFDELYLDEQYWDFSRTTSKYLTQFLNEYPWVRRRLNEELGNEVTHQNIGVTQLRKLIDMKSVHLVNMN